MLIVLRVAQGRGWTQSKVRETRRLATESRRSIPLNFIVSKSSVAKASTTVATAVPSEKETGLSGARGELASINVESVVVKDSDVTPDFA